MTESEKRPKRKNIPFVFITAILSILVICRADAAIDGVTNALSVCANTVIPSLFPFMVISELIVRSGVTEYLGKYLSPAFRALFGIRGQGASAYLLGMLCGFPIGAKSAVALCEDGNISKSELSRLLCFCNMPSSAFIISAVGVSLFGSESFGITLYLITVLSSLCIGIGMKMIFGVCHADNGQIQVNQQKDKATGIRTFTNAVVSSAESMICVCAFIIFFSALIGTLDVAFSKEIIPKTAKALVTGVVEMTNGIRECARLGRTETALTLCAAVVGWSGISVHFQIGAICQKQKVNMKPYIAAKAAQGGLNALLMCAYLRIANPDFKFSAESKSVIALNMPQRYIETILILFIIASLCAILKKFAEMRQKSRG